MQRRAFLNASLTAGLALTGVGRAAESNARGEKPVARKVADQTPRRTQQPNVIVLLADDLGWGDLGCYGHPLLKTPHIDKLAKAGCRFTNFYASMPICSPTRASILTGRDPNRFGFKHVINTGMVNPHVQVPVVHHLPVDEPSVARVLSDAGYRTCHIGKWHLSLPDAHPSEPGPADYGFTESLITTGSPSLYHGPARWMRDGTIVEMGPEVSYPKLYVDTAIDFIKADSDKPFFLNLWSFTPHVREEASEPFRKLYPETTPQEQTYFGCISEMDEQYGRLLDFLDAEGLAENTIVIFCSDNGPEPPVLEANHPEARRGSTGGLRGSKHVLYEGGIRVPGIIRWPGVTRPGSTCHEPVSVVDLLPTLCAVANTPLPPHHTFDGTNLVPILKDEPIQRPHPLYWQCAYAQNTFVSSDYKSPPLALRDGAFKLFADADFNSRALYNLDWDPNEQWDLSSVHPDKVASMLQELKTVYASINNADSRRDERWLNPNLPGYRQSAA